MIFSSVMLEHCRWRAFHFFENSKPANLFFGSCKEYSRKRLWRGKGWEWWLLALSYTSKCRISKIDCSSMIYLLFRNSNCPPKAIPVGLLTQLSLAAVKWSCNATSKTEGKKNKNFFLKNKILQFNVLGSSWL